MSVLDAHPKTFKSKENKMKIRIIDLAYDIDCPQNYEGAQALIPFKNARPVHDAPFAQYASVEDGDNLWMSEEPVLSVNVEIICDTFLVNDDHIVILFPDGNEATFEICSDDWAAIWVI